MQIDLTKTRPRHVWVGLDPEDDIIGFWQLVKYENVPPYCEYCKHQGHDIDECKSKLRDEEQTKEIKRMGEIEQKQRLQQSKGT